LYFDKELAKNFSNLKNTWELIKSATNTGSLNRPSISKLIINNVSLTGSYQIACQLNEFFTSMPGKIASEIPPFTPKQCDQPTQGENTDNIPLLSFSKCPVTESEVLEAMSMLKAKKSEDFNGVSMLLLKNFINMLSALLKHIFNCSLSTRRVPLQFKIAKVIPLFKSGDSTQPDNYRPISLLSSFSKILEKVVCLRLSSFLESNNIL